MKKISLALILITLIALILPTRTVSAETTVPMISILGVTEDVKVTVETKNFPANRDFVARMGAFGTQGVDGVRAGVVNSGKGGSLKFTFEIPDSLHDLSKIAIRLESTSSGHYAYNWFTNTTFGTHTGGISADDVPAQAEILVA